MYTYQKHYTQLLKTNTNGCKAMTLLQQSFNRKLQQSKARYQHHSRIKPGINSKKYYRMHTILWKLNNSLINDDWDD